MKCNEHEANNFSQSGAKVKDIYRRLESLRNNHKGSKVEKIALQIGTNHNQREKLRDKSRKIFKFLQKVKPDFKDVVVYFLSVLSKPESVVFEPINYINETLLNLCAATSISLIITHLHLIINQMRFCFGKIKYIPIGKT